MTYCAQCGGLLTGAATHCHRCGEPASGAKTSRRTRMAILALVLGAGCLVLVALGGLVATLAFPDFLEALKKAEQKRTIAALRNLGAALMAYEVDHGAFPAAASVDELVGALAPEYIPEVPTQDAWERPLRYECWSAGEEGGTCVHFAIGSAGQDGEWEQETLREYGAPESFAPAQRDRDIVYVDGFFTRWPRTPPP